MTSRACRLLLSLTALLVLGGCMAYEEVQHNMDFVIGKGYAPPAEKASSYIPHRILLLPVTGWVDERYKREFINTFRTCLNAQEAWTVVDWPEGSVDGTRLQIVPEQAADMARRLNCDAILYVRLEDSNIYPPLRQCVRYSLEEAANRAVIVSAFQDYDANNKNVANSARSFYQTNLNRHDAPDKSLVILQSNPPFLKYVATASAESIKRAMLPPAK